MLVHFKSVDFRLIAMAMYSHVTIPYCKPEEYGIVKMADPASPEADNEYWGWWWQNYSYWYYWAAQSAYGCQQPNQDDYDKQYKQWLEYFNSGIHSGIQQVASLTQQPPHVERAPPRIIGNLNCFAEEHSMSL